MRLGADWMVAILDANDHDAMEYAEAVPIADIVPGDEIEIQGHPRFVVADVSMIRERAEQHLVRRYVVTSDEGEAFTLPGKRKVRRL